MLLHHKKIKFLRSRVFKAFNPILNLQHANQSQQQNNLQHANQLQQQNNLQHANQLQQQTSLQHANQLQQQTNPTSQLNNLQHGNQPIPNQVQNKPTLPQFVKINNPHQPQDQTQQNQTTQSNNLQLGNKPLQPSLTPTQNKPHQLINSSFPQPSANQPQQNPPPPQQNNLQPGNQLQQTNNQPQNQQTTQIIRTVQLPQTNSTSIQSNFSANASNQPTNIPKQIPNQFAKAQQQPNLPFRSTSLNLQNKASNLPPQSTATKPLIQPISFIQQQQQISNNNVVNSDTQKNSVLLRSQVISSVATAQTNGNNAVGNLVNNPVNNAQGSQMKVSPVQPNTNSVLHSSIPTTNNPNLPIINGNTPQPVLNSNSKLNNGVTGTPKVNASTMNLNNERMPINTNPISNTTTNKSTQQSINTANNQLPNNTKNISVVANISLSKKVTVIGNAPIGGHVPQSALQNQHNQNPQYNNVQTTNAMSNNPDQIATVLTPHNSTANQTNFGQKQQSTVMISNNFNLKSTNNQIAQGNTISNAISPPKSNGIFSSNVQSITQMDNSLKTNIVKSNLSSTVNQQSFVTNSISNQNNSNFVPSVQNNNFQKPNPVAIQTQNIANPPHLNVNLNNNTSSVLPINNNNLIPNLNVANKTLPPNMVAPNSPSPNKGNSNFTIQTNPSTGTNLKQYNKPLIFHFPSLTEISCFAISKDRFAITDPGHKETTKFFESIEGYQTGK